MAHIAAREQIESYMNKEDISILVLAETHVNSNSKEISGDHIFVFSTGVTDKEREEGEKIREQL